MIVRYGPCRARAGEAWATELATIMQTTDKPVIVSLGRAPDTAGASLDVFDRHHIPWMLTPTRTAVAAGALAQFAQKQRAISPHRRAESTPHAVRRASTATRYAASDRAASKACLAAYGIGIAREVVLAPMRLLRL